MKQITAYACDSCSHIDASEREMTWHEQAHERERAERLKREATGQITIGQIIQKCEALNPLLPIVISCSDKKYDGKYPGDLDSYRGYYDELAIDSNDEGMSLSSFLKEMRSSLHRTYSGYKGGEYGMNEDTFVWLAGYGRCTNVAITDVRLSSSGETVQLVATRLGEDW